MSSTEQNAEQFVELLQRFIRLRPRLKIPEHIVQFKQQMESLRKSSGGNPEDLFFLIRVCIILSHSETPPTMGELSSELDIPLSSTTRIVDWLVSAKFVERTNDPSDRRVVRIQMSENGRQFYQTAMKFNKVRVTHMLNNFSSEEQKQLLQLMAKLFDSLLAEK
jgi:DNA-binding MarR family transcriptional regulator